MKGDLHLHSHYSDGLFSPAEVMRRAYTAGCDIVALTDHDTVDGVREACACATEYGMRNIPAVEISTFDTCEIHILGYGVSLQSSAFSSFIAAQQQRRRERAQKLLDNLALHGITIPPEALQGAVPRPVSRTHIAAAMVRLGYEKDFHEAIRKWLHRGSPTFVPMVGSSPADAVRHIHAAGGAAVLAHPVRMDMDPYERTAYIRRLAAEGLDGIEAVYKRSSRAVVCSFKSLARELGLFVTGGADFHGDSNEIIPRGIDIRFLRKCGIQ